MQRKTSKKRATNSSCSKEANQRWWRRRQQQRLYASKQQQQPQLRKNKATDKRRVFEVPLLMQVKVGEAIGAPGRRSDCLTRPHQVGQQPSWFSLSFSIQDSACVPVCFSSGWVGEKGWEVGKRQPGNSPQRLSLKPPLPHLTLCPGSPDKPTNTHTRA